MEKDKDEKKSRPSKSSDEEARGGNANSGMPSQNDSNWARENETRRK